MEIQAANGLPEAFCGNHLNKVMNVNMIGARHGASSKNQQLFFDKSSLRTLIGQIK